MDDNKEDADILLVGVNLASEAHTYDRSRDVTLGVVSIQPNVTNLDDLRNVLCIQLKAVPASFTFLTKQGWSIGRSQENHVKIKQVLSEDNLVRVNRCYEKPRVGVRTKAGTAVGFVFIDHAASVSALRDAIEQQFGQISSLSSSSYQFVDRNGWPLQINQEANLAVIDLLHNATVTIQPYLELLPLDCTDGTLCSATQAPVVTKRPRLTSSNLRQLTFQTSKDQERQISVDENATFKPKQILISYVRSEAAQHALDLKQSLTALGCVSVYLDVHEIKSGVDWADSLNFAVSNCEVFVPLVTARYGETLWTNREVKLADITSKLIIPVSFLDYWPPKCLAIQFASTQFIPWKPACTTTCTEHADDNEFSPDTSEWPDGERSLVAKTVVERVQLHQEQNRIFPASQLTRKLTTLRSCPLRSSLPDEFSELSEPREGRPLVVISLHPDQTDVGKELKEFVESAGYEVWCSSDLHSPELFPEEEEKILGSDEELFTSQGSEKGSVRFADCAYNENNILSSQLSQLSMSQCGSPSNLRRKRDFRIRFQEKTDEAGVVIFVLSEAFAKSKMSRMQVFYCEHRKRVIALKYEDFNIPSWMSMLIGTGVFEDMKTAGYKEALLSRIKMAIDPNSKGLTDPDQDSAAEGEHQLRNQLPNGIYVYIAGGTKFYNDTSSNICEAIGKKLAQYDDISMATGGFRGAGEQTSYSYNQERERLGKESNLQHILPVRDTKDRSRQTNQNKDGTFSPVRFGNTIFSGQSVRERETIVSRVFDICVLIEGGPGAAYEAEQFSWNGHFVIPIKVTGGAAGGKFNVPEKIFKKPCGVCSENWSTLNDKSATSEDISDAVSAIVCRLKEKLKLDSPAYTQLKKPALCSQPTKKIDELETDKSTSNLPRSGRKRKSTQKDK